MIQLNKVLPLALEAAIKAGKAILEVYELSDFGTEVKDDNSPLTLADIASSDMIN